MVTVVLKIYVKTNVQLPNTLSILNNVDSDLSLLYHNRLIRRKSAQEKTGNSIHKHREQEVQNVASLIRNLLRRWRTERSSALVSSRDCKKIGSQNRKPLVAGIQFSK
jgi:hypothetical protein